MTEYFIEVIFDGVDLEDDVVLEALGRSEISGATHFDAETTAVGAVIEAPNALRAAEIFLAKVRTELPDSRPVRAARDLVNNSEIAERVGVTRQAVNNWASGRRRGGDFPLPIDVLGDQKIWEWGAVNAWLRFNLALDDGLYYPTPLELGEIDAYIKNVRLTATEKSVNSYEMWHAVLRKVSAASSISSLLPESLPSDAHLFATDNNLILNLQNDIYQRPLIINEKSQMDIYSSIWQKLIHFEKPDTLKPEDVFRPEKYFGPEELEEIAKTVPPRPDLKDGQSNSKKAVA